MTERKLKEISRDQFWKLEDAIVAQRHLHISGNLEVERQGDDKTYRNSQGVWLKSYKGVYFAHAKMMDLLR